MQIFVNPDYKFVKHRWTGVIISSLLLLAGLVGYLTFGVNWGIDFAGGATLTLKFRETPPISELRSELQDATIQQYGQASDNAVLIRLPKTGREGDYAGQVTESLVKKFNPESASKHDLNYLGSDRLSTLLRQRDPDNKGTQPSATEYYDALSRRIIENRSKVGIFTNMSQVTATQGVTAATAKVLNEQTFLGDFIVLNAETVGPQVGAELQRKALLAIILSSLAMGIYIWLRFRDLAFGVASIICIIHDVAIALAFMLLMRLEFSLNIIAALLTIVGYSINDTVVMFDRVRENKRKIKKPMDISEHLDLAINQTLSRTILTSGTVFLVLLALLAFGGEVIRGFAWILTIGVISGTYSTLIIVPAVVVALEKWKSNRRPAAAASVSVDTPTVESSRKRRAS
jgi:preprotein translocase subunit SecF